MLALGIALALVLGSRDNRKVFAYPLPVVVFECLEMPVKMGKIHQVFSLASNFQHGARGWWIRFLLMASRVEDSESG